ncbi:MAG TPA: hypothetical protein VKB09_01555 [Thermomicrobiales bacterium]|nr:hypothetical protein [Thermomicrobiales bacterium]
MGDDERDAAYVLGPWQDDRMTLTATGPDTASALAAGLEGIFAASRGDAGTTGEEATVALAIHASGADAAELFAGLASALRDEIEDEDYDVRAVRFDGMVRTDEGLAGWGYALAIPGKSSRPELVVEEVEVTPGGGVVTLRATLRSVP